MMKWMIASDIHGSAFYCEKMIAAYRSEQADRLLLLGDLLYHGPRNDLPKEYAPKKVISMLNEIKDELVCVRGNCEAEVDQMVLAFPVLSDSCLLCESGRLIFATHGHHFNTSSLPPHKKGDILLHGHTHIPACEEADGMLYINPGSVSIPKADSPYSYMTLENGIFRWKDLETGVCYREYRL